MKPLCIAGCELRSRLFLGSGKFSSPAAMQAAIAAAGTELITVALRRVDLADPARDDVLPAVDRARVRVMLNTSGARTAAEAVRIAEFGRAAGFSWIKLEIHPDPVWLLPDPIETLAAATILVKQGFVVLPYINADPVLAKRLEEVGCHAIMPLGAPIGSNQGLQTIAMLRIIIEQATVPVVVDAGLGMPSHAAAAIELGAAAVLVNTAIATAADPAAMARAFALAVEAAALAVAAGPSDIRREAVASSPGDLFSGRNLVD